MSIQLKFSMFLKFKVIIPYTIDILVNIIINQYLPYSILTLILSIGRPLPIYLSIISKISYIFYIHTFIYIYIFHM